MHCAPVIRLKGCAPLALWLAQPVRGPLPVSHESKDNELEYIYNGSCIRQGYDAIIGEVNVGTIVTA